MLISILNFVSVSTFLLIRVRDYSPLYQCLSPDMMPLLSAHLLSVLTPYFDFLLSYLQVSLLSFLPSSIIQHCLLLFIYRDPPAPQIWLLMDPHTCSPLSCLLMSTHTIPHASLHIYINMLHAFPPLAYIY